MFITAFTQVQHKYIVPGHTPYLVDLLTNKHCWDAMQAECESASPSSLPKHGLCLDSIWQLIRVGLWNLQTGFSVHLGRQAGLLEQIKHCIDDVTYWQSAHETVFSFFTTQKTGSSNTFLWLIKLAFKMSSFEGKQDIVLGLGLGRVMRQVALRASSNIQQSLVIREHTSLTLAWRKKSQGFCIMFSSSRGFIWYPIFSYSKRN